MMQKKNPIIAPKKSLKVFVNTRAEEFVIDVLRGIPLSVGKLRNITFPGSNIAATLVYSSILVQISVSL